LSDAQQGSCSSTVSALPRQPARHRKKRSPPPKQRKKIDRAKNAKADDKVKEKQFRKNWGEGAGDKSKRRAQRVL